MLLTAEAVLAAIRTVTGPAGCLLIIKNYTGELCQGAEVMAVISGLGLPFL